MDLGPFVVWRKARSVQRSKYTCSERVPLEIKWASTCAGDRDVFTGVKMCGWSTACHACCGKGSGRGVWCGVLSLKKSGIYQEPQEHNMNPQELNPSWKRSVMYKCWVWLLSVCGLVAGLLFCGGLDRRPCLVGCVSLLSMRYLLCGVKKRFHVHDGSKNDNYRKNSVHYGS